MTVYHKRMFNVVLWWKNNDKGQRSSSLVMQSSGYTMNFENKFVYLTFGRIISHKDRWFFFFEKIIFNYHGLGSVVTVFPNEPEEIFLDERRRIDGNIERVMPLNEMLVIIKNKPILLCNYLPSLVSSQGMRPNIVSCNKFDLGVYNMIWYIQKKD